jgi:hypothetical protein
LLINVSGVNPLRDWTKEIPRRILIDTDPVFTQIRHLTDPSAKHRAKQHNLFFSFGERISSGESSVPSDGFPWQATRQPVVMDCWKAVPAPSKKRFTTVMQWQSYPAVQYHGKRFGLKADSFEQFLDLPSRIDGTLELALGSSSAPREELRSRGWQLVNPLEITRDLWTYQDYIKRSTAEFSVAKQGYVTTNSGWFSERSACYLASGRPVVLQDTGFSRFLPGGFGLHSFHDIASAVAAIESIMSHYLRQCESAREIAYEFFNSDFVLNNLFERTFTLESDDDSEQ